MEIKHMKKVHWKILISLKIKYLTKLYIFLKKNNLILFDLKILQYIIKKTNLKMIYDFYQYQ